jgi:hypothetical protein
MEENSISNIKENNGMLYYNKLTSKRIAFINQLYNLINTQFEEQEKLKDLEPAKIIEELENNSDYIQRIFIDAPWGMGKTFFSKALKEKIEKENESRGEVGRKEIKFININAWETDYFSDPMKSIIGELNTHKLLNSETQRVIEKIMENIFKAGGKFLLNFFLKKFQISADDWEDLKSILNGVSTSELKDYKNYKELVDKFKECLSLEKDLKVIVIDELDRCKPTYAIELLETIKHFFGVKNIIFVFLVNKKQLQSIVSTSYLQDDECSEYFEKFFDIQFNLPELEYEDFIQIEYDKYNQPQTYGVNNENISEDNIKIYESIFLEAFSSNCDSSIVSPRNFIKSFKKFRILLTSLSDEERACYPLMIVLILYFIREEFLNKKLEFLKQEKNYTEEDISIFSLYILTFFEKTTVDLNQKKELDFNRNVNINLKTKYQINKDFYTTFLRILYFKTGNTISYLNREHRVNYLMIMENSNNNENTVFINIQDYFFQFKNILFNHFFHNMLQFAGTIQIDSKFFSKKSLEKNIIDKNDKRYNIAILLEWAEQKYNFTMNIK